MARRVPRSRVARSGGVAWTSWPAAARRARCDALPSRRKTPPRTGIASSAAIAAGAIGVPQLVLPRHLEQRLTGEALSAAGIGGVLRRAAVGQDLAPRALAMMADEGLATRALEVARAVPRADEPCARAMAVARQLVAGRREAFR